MMHLICDFAFDYSSQTMRESFRFQDKDIRVGIEDLGKLNLATIRNL